MNLPRSASCKSLSSRRAWIEIASARYRDRWLVALLTESVDRNHQILSLIPRKSIVALLTESVDRNRGASTPGTAIVALLTESVDRNPETPEKLTHCPLCCIIETK